MVDKTSVAMVCVTALGIAKLLIDGDGLILVTAITAIGTLAGVNIGAQTAKKENASSSESTKTR